jgi:hypothetical protein
VFVGFGVHDDRKLRKKGDRLGDAGRIESLSAFRHAERVCPRKTPVSSNPDTFGFGKLRLDGNGRCVRLIREKPA